jgi:hypothetical protein
MCQQFTELIHASASMFIMQETSEDNSDAAADIPRNLQASAADMHPSEVKQYLESLAHPLNLTDIDFHKFMQYSSGFCISNGKLWWRDTHGKHKIVVLKEKRYELLKEVHDILGHKMIYAVLVRSNMSPISDLSNALPPYPTDSRCSHFTLPQGPC